MTALIISMYLSWFIYSSSGPLRGSLYMIYIMQINQLVDYLAHLTIRNCLGWSVTHPTLFLIQFIMRLIHVNKILIMTSTCDICIYLEARSIVDPMKCWIQYDNKLCMFLKCERDDSKCFGMQTNMLLQTQASLSPVRVQIYTIQVYNIVTCTQRGSELACLASYFLLNLQLIEGYPFGYQLKCLLQRWHKGTTVHHNMKPCACSKCSTKVHHNIGVILKSLLFITRKQCDLDTQFHSSL